MSFSNSFVEVDGSKMYRDTCRGYGFGLFVCGRAQTVIETFEAHWNDMRFGNLPVMGQSGTLPADLTRKNLELFARHVLPALKKP